MNNKNFIIITIILITVSVIGFISYLPPRSDAGAKIKVADFPMTVGEWSATEMPLEEKVYEILETRNLFVRDYKDLKGESIYLYMVYSEDNRKVSHPPEVCLLGSGVTVVDKTPLQITNSIKATKLVVEKVNSRQIVVYWFKAGSLNTDKYLKQQIKIVIDRMFGKRTSGALIRISIEIKDNKQEEALELIRRFARQVEPLLSRYIP